MLSCLRWIFCVFVYATKLMFCQSVHRGGTTRVSQLLSLFYRLSCLGHTFLYNMHPDYVWGCAFDFLFKNSERLQNAIDVASKQLYGDDRENVIAMGVHARLGGACVFVCRCSLVCACRKCLCVAQHVSMIYPVAQDAPC